MHSSYTSGSGVWGSLRLASIIVQLCPHYAHMHNLCSKLCQHNVHNLTSKGTTYTPSFTIQSLLSKITVNEHWSKVLLAPLQNVYSGLVKSML